MRSSEVGSAQCRSSKASTTGCVPRPRQNTMPSPPRVAVAAIPPARISPRAPRAAEYRPAARSGARIRPGRGRPDAQCSRGLRGGLQRQRRRRQSAVRPHSARGCSGVFCRSCEATHSTQVCGVSASRARNSSIRRDLPRPGSPTIRTNWPSPARARVPAARQQRPISSSRPTNGVSARAPPRRPPPLARTTR